MVKGTNGWRVVCKNGMGSCGWCVVYIGKGVENGAMVVCERRNGRCDLQGSMKHDELGDMGHFVPMRIKVY